MVFAAMDNAGKPLIATQKDLNIAAKYFDITAPVELFSTDHPVDLATRKAIKEMAKLFGFSANEFLYTWPNEDEKKRRLAAYRD